MITKMITKKTEEHIFDVSKKFYHHNGLKNFKKNPFECLTIRIFAKMDKNGSCHHLTITLP